MIGSTMYRPASVPSMLDFMPRTPTLPNPQSHFAQIRAERYRPGLPELGVGRQREHSRDPQLHRPLINVYRQAAIVGIGQSEFARKSERTAWELAVQAVLGALADAGLEASEIDGLIRYDAPNELVSQGLLVRTLGIRELRWFSNAPYGGEATGAVVSHAAAAIAAKQASVVVLYRSLSQSTSGRMGRADTRYGSSEVVYASGERTPGGEFAGPYGLLSPGQVFALWASRYKYENSVSDDDFARALGTLAIQQRQYAQTNPAAIMKNRPMTWDDYYNSRMIDWPLRMFDCVSKTTARARWCSSMRSARGPCALIRYTCSARPSRCRHTPSRSRRTSAI